MNVFMDKRPSEYVNGGNMSRMVINSQINMLSC